MFPRGADVGGDHDSAARHGFCHRRAVFAREPGKAHEVGRLVEPDHDFGRHCSGEQDPSFDTLGVRHIPELAHDPRWHVAAHDKLTGNAQEGWQAGEGGDQCLDVVVAVARAGHRTNAGSRPGTDDCACK